MKKIIVIIVFSLIAMLSLYLFSNKNKLIYSKESGFYKNPFYLRIHKYFNYTLRYTEDGTTPTLKSKIYTNKIFIKDITDTENKYLSFLKEQEIYKKGTVENISGVNDSIKNFMPTDTSIPKCNILTFGLFDKKDNLIKVEKKIYCIGEASKKEFQTIPAIFLNFEKNALFSKNGGLYDNFELIPDTEINKLKINEINYNLKKSIDLNILNKNKLEISTSAKARISGGISRFHPQKSFKIYTNTKYKNFILDSCSTDFLKIKDYIVNSIQLKNKYNPCTVFLNGEFLGVYYIKEDINEKYIRKRFKIKKNNLYFMKDGKYNCNEAETELNNLKDRIINSSFQEIEKEIDINSFTTFYATNIYLDNADLTNFRNTIFYKNIKKDTDSNITDTKWRALNKDFNLFSVMKERDLCISCDQLVNNNFFMNLLKHKEFYTMLKNKIEILENETYTEEKLNKAIEDYKKTIFPLAKLTNEIYYSKDIDELEYIKLKNFFKNRKKTVMNEIEKIHNR